MTSVSTVVDLGTGLRRLACLADVHGNTAALEAVVASPEFARADAVALLGCITTGPEPLAVLQICAELGIPTFFLRGNGERAVDEMAQGGRPAETPVDEWLVAAHATVGLQAIRSWPTALTVTLPGLGAVRMCHGSPRSDIELWSPATADDRVRAACEGVAEPTVVHGHTHLQYRRSVADRQVVGAGSVGLPYTAGMFGARWALLGPDVELVVTPYDLEEAERRVQASGYPGAARFVNTLRRPPHPDDIMADTEARHFSD